LLFGECGDRTKVHLDEGACTCRSYKQSRTCFQDGAPSHSFLESRHEVGLPVSLGLGAWVVHCFLLLVVRKNMIFLRPPGMIISVLAKETQLFVELH
jgi:hypothetical protein